MEFLVCQFLLGHQPKSDLVLPYETNEIIYVKGFENKDQIYYKLSEMKDLKLVEELSTKESFAEEIQAKLIEIAEQKEDSEAFSIFEVCRQVNSEKIF